MIWEILAWATFPVAIVFFGWATQDDDENWFWGPVVSGGLIYLGIKTTHLPVWSWAKDNLYGLMFIAVYYLVAGVAWSMIKFYAKAKKITKEDINSRAMMYSDGVIRSDDTEKAERDMFYNIFKKTPKWIAFWPASLAWSALSNWLKEFFVMVADAFKKAYWQLFKTAIGE
jgi:hypothetical protein